MPIRVARGWAAGFKTVVLRALSRWRDDAGAEMRRTSRA
jgi:hypothetical protein